MGSMTESVEVAVPVRTAYDQWTQFEEFPQFMAGVEEVRQVSDDMTHWRVESAGRPGSSTPGSPSRSRTSGSPGRPPRARARPVW